MGIFFSTLLTVIITLYTSHFIQNQTKEFGLYTVRFGRSMSLANGIQMLFNWVVTSIKVLLGYLTEV